MTAHAGPQDKPAYRWLVLTAATAAQATASFALLGLAALAGFLQRDFNLTAAETGLLITASYAAPLFSLLFVGDLLDRKSERLIIGIGAVVLFVPFLFAAASHHYTALLFWLFIAGLGYSATQPGGSKSVSAWFRGGRLGLAMGIRQAGLPLGGAVAAAILPAVAAAWSWRAAFVAGAVAALAGGLFSRWSTGHRQTTPGQQHGASHSVPPPSPDCCASRGCATPSSPASHWSARNTAFSPG